MFIWSANLVGDACFMLLVSVVRESLRGPKLRRWNGSSSPIDQSINLRGSIGHHRGWTLQVCSLWGWITTTWWGRSIRCGCGWKKCVRNVCEVHLQKMKFVQMRCWLNRTPLSQIIIIVGSRSAAQKHNRARRELNTKLHRRKGEEGRRTAAKITSSALKIDEYRLEGALGYLGVVEV